MSSHCNPSVVDDGLVFLYDVEDIQSYKGEPTVNLATDSPSQGGWAGGREVLDSSRKKFRFIVNNFNGSAGSGQGWRSFTWDLNSYSGQSVTISATVEVPSASSGTFAWVMMGQTNTHTSNNSGAGQYMGYSAASERVSKSTTTTEHITWTGTVGSTGTASQPSGHVGFTLWYNGGTIGVDSYVEVSNVQVEINSHATQFVNGTRSATQGLLDRTGTSTINISNASFDSNAQMTFDGTDDYINDASFDMGTPTDITLECIIRFNGSLDSADRKVMHYNKTGGTNAVFQLRKGNSASRLMYQAHNGSQWYTMTDTDAIESDTWAHFMITHSGTSAIMYKNGVQSATATMGNLHWTNANNLLIGYRANSEYWKGDIPIMKIYNRALTSTEVLQNFNSTKSRFGL